MHLCEKHVNLSLDYDDVNNTTMEKGCSINISDERSTGTEEMSTVALIDQIHFYYTPLIVILGSCGNMLSVLVLCKTKLRLLSSSYYLAALAVSDTGFLVSLAAVWLDQALVDIPVYNRDGICQFVTYITYVCSFLSVWYVVAFTVERYIAICHPLHRQAICTIRQAKLVVISLGFLALAAYLFVFFMAEVLSYNKNRPNCSIREDKMNVMYILNSVDTVITLLIPLCAIIVLNIKIVKAMRKYENERNPETSNSKESFENGALRSSCNRRHKTQIKITKTLLIISTVFLCFNFPSYAIRIWMYIQRFTFQGQLGTVTTYNVQQASQLIFHTNFAINFCLYCISGSNFRKALVAFCRCSSLTRENTFTGAEMTKMSFVDRNFGSSSFRTRIVKMSETSSDL